MTFTVSSCNQIIQTDIKILIELKKDSNFLKANTSNILEQCPCCCFAFQQALGPFLCGLPKALPREQLYNPLKHGHNHILLNMCDSNFCRKFISTEFILFIVLYEAQSRSTKTFPFVAETKMRPQLTGIIAASSGTMKADEVAKKTLNGIKSGSFIVPCNFDGLLLAIATAGLSPQRSVLMALCEVFAAGPTRFIGLCIQWGWYRSIKRWYAQNN